MAKIMVVAGGDWQIELIKKAKKMGHFVICSNLYEKSPAFPYADACEVADVLDKEANLKIAQKYMPDAVITDQSDIAVGTVAYLNEKLGLRGIGCEKALLFTNKAASRMFCRKNDIPVPDFQLCHTAEEAAAFLEKYGKALIKPIDSQSSRGVFTIRNKDELYQHYKETLSYSNSAPQFLIEEMLEGDEFTIDGIVADGMHVPLCISIKEMYRQNQNASKMQTYTYEHPVYDYDQLRKVNRKLMETAQIPFGLTHSEYKFHKGEYYLIEAAVRGGGSNLSAKIVPFMSEIDNYDYYIRNALGEKTDISRLVNLKLPKEKCVIMRFFDFGAGTVKQLHGLDFLKNSPNMIDFQMEVKKGDVLTVPEYGRQRPGHFTIGSCDLKSLQMQAERIVERVFVTFE